MNKTGEAIVAILALLAAGGAMIIKSDNVEKEIAERAKVEEAALEDVDQIEDDQ